MLQNPLIGDLKALQPQANKGNVKKAEAADGFMSFVDVAQQAFDTAQQTTPQNQEANSPSDPINTETQNTSRSNNSARSDEAAASCSSDTAEKSGESNKSAIDENAASNEEVKGETKSGAKASSQINSPGSESAKSFTPAQEASAKNAALNSKNSLENLLKIDVNSGSRSAESKSAIQAPKAMPAVPANIESAQSRFTPAENANQTSDPARSMKMLVLSGQEALRRLELQNKAVGSNTATQKTPFNAPATESGKAVNAKADAYNQQEKSTVHFRDEQPAATRTANAGEAKQPDANISNQQTAQVREAAVKAPESAAKTLSTTPQTALRVEQIQSIMDKASSRLTQMAQGGGGKSVIVLKPAHLGRIRLEIDVKDAIVKAKITTESSSVRAVLETEAPHLRETLQQHGMKLEQLEIKNGWNKNAFAGGDAGAADQKREQAMPKPRRDSRPVIKTELNVKPVAKRYNLNGTLSVTA